MSIMEELVRNILEARFENFDAEVVQHAKNRIIDVIGCLISGAKAPGSSMLVDLVREWGGREEATILVHGVKAPAHNAAMVNSVMARSYDFEPVLPYVEGIPVSAHVSGTTVPTALAVAEQKGASGKELITALILGDDITSRIIAASDYSFDKGFDGTGVQNMFGATAIAGRLGGLDEHQLLNAFGIVVNQMAGSFQCIYDGVHSFKLHQGLSARAGIFSVELAGRGFTGIRDPLMSKHGYSAQYSRIVSPDILTRGLGKKFYSDSIFKPYPGCAGNITVVECALELVRKHHISAEDISEVIVNTTPVHRDMFLGQPFKIRDVPQVDAAFNFQYNVANALLRKGSRLEHFTEESIRDPEVLGLIQKVKITASKPFEKPFAAEVEVVMKNGDKFSAYFDIPKGNVIYNPITKHELIEKFRANVAFSRTVAEENAEKARSLIEKLEDMDNIAEIIKEIS